MSFTLNQFQHIIRPTLLHVNDFFTIPLDESYCSLAKDIFNKVGTGEIVFAATHHCYLWELRPSQQNIYSHKVQWMLLQTRTPPIVVMDYQKRLYCIDGHHRIIAAILKKQPDIECHIVKVDYKTVIFGS